MWQYQHSDELYHHGILGMRWGIRRYQPYSKGKHGTFLGQSRDEDIRISKGTEAQRVQSGKDIDGKGQTYVTFDRFDHLEYIAATASGEGGVCVDAKDTNGNEGRGYSVRLQLSEDIIAPSYQKTMDAFINTVGQVGIKEMQNSFSSRDKGKEFIKNYKKLSVDECRDEAYRAFVGTFMRDTKAKQIFFNDLQNQGYNAVIDDWDAKFGKGYSRTPMIVFNKENTVKQVKSEALTKEDYDYFKEIFWGDTEYAKRRSPNAYEKWDKYAPGWHNRLDEDN